MRAAFLLGVILSVSVDSAQATYIWMSPSDVASPLGEVPLVESATGLTDQEIHIWARPDPNKTLTAWSLNLRSTNEGVIAFKDIEIYNLVLGEPSVLLPKTAVR